ncbi:MAG TPA: pur operon repressor [Symbiobacteriaceae bacterium]|nr:pur operon repressor [Symbiobacteriaceae bacterium]
MAELPKLHRSQRLVHMMKILTERPGEQIPLSYFMDRFSAAKSTISEDLALIKEALESEGSGLLRTHAGAIGGVQYWPIPSPGEVQETLGELCRLLQDPARILPGGFVYMTDIVTHPLWSARIGGIMAARFLSSAPDTVLTVETKGIPLALMVARALGIPMVMARREGRVTEGPAFTIHYISGSTRRINAMTVGLRALRRDARVLIVDDFMKAGATARGMVDLVTELGASVAGVGIFVTTAEPQKKRVEEYVSLLTLVDVNEEERSVVVLPATEKR